MNILTLDTATEQCSAALLYNGQLFHQSVHAPNQHAELILPMIDELLTNAHGRIADLDVIGFGRGPGSFTGVRIAISIAQGLASPFNIPVAPFSTLLAIASFAQQTHGATKVLAALDARKDQIYWGGFIYLGGVWQTLIPEQVSDPDALLAVVATGDWSGVGNGFALPRLQAATPGLAQVWPNLFPQAHSMLTVTEIQHSAGHSIAAENASPFYLRDKIC